MLGAEQARLSRVAHWPLGTAPPPHHPQLQLQSRASLPRRFPEKTKQHVTGEMTCFLALGLWIMDVRVPHKQNHKDVLLCVAQKCFLGSAVNRKHGAKNTGMKQAG